MFFAKKSVARSAVKRAASRSLRNTVASVAAVAMLSGFSLVASAGAAQGGDIVDVAASNGSFNTLVTAVKAADLVATLKGPGPFTVFAPNDAAFAKLPDVALKGLLADKAALTNVLTYHVVPGKVMAADVKAGKVKTVQGSELTITVENGTVMVDGAKVIATDVAASNGVIHVIDSVIQPE